MSSARSSETIRLIQPLPLVLFLFLFSIVTACITVQMINGDGASETEEFDDEFDGRSRIDYKDTDYDDVNLTDTIKAP